MRSLEGVQSNFGSNPGFITGGVVGVAFGRAAQVRGVRVGRGPADDLNLGSQFDPRTDVAVVPLTDTSIGLVWQDGDLRKTVFECAP